MLWLISFVQFAPIIPLDAVFRISHGTLITRMDTSNTVPPTTHDYQNRARMHSKNAARGLPIIWLNYATHPFQRDQHSPHLVTRVFGESLSGVARRFPPSDGSRTLRRKRNKEYSRGVCHGPKTNGRIILQKEAERYKRTLPPTDLKRDDVAPLARAGRFRPEPYSCRFCHPRSLAA